MRLARQWLRRVTGDPGGRARDAGARRPEPSARGATLVGHPYAVLGVGEYVRAAARAFEAAAIPFRIRNTYEWNDAFADKHPTFDLADRISDHSPFTVNVFHMNADEMEGARRALGADFFAGRYNIGCWHWELSRFPEAWRPAFDLVDEVWASSRFIQHALSEKTRLPVTWIPHPVHVEARGRYRRRDLGLPDRGYVFLLAFDFTSYVARKNPGAVLKAFHQAFGPPGSDEAVLVVKLNGTAVRSAEAQAFRSRPELADPRVHVIDEVLPDDRMHALIELSDCFVSLHRSEGFGRGLAESMTLGKPVIATAYSGNMDFTNAANACLVDYTLVPVGPSEYPYPEGQVWADPDIDQAAWYMRKLVREPAWGRRIGRRAAALVRMQHGPAAVGARCRARLEKLGFL